MVLTIPSHFATVCAASLCRAASTVRLAKPRRLLLALLLLLAPTISFGQSREADTETLGKALEYFTSGKYHESLLLFQQIEKKYKLNDRFKAYIGLCYYHEWEYEEATKYFDAFLPKLDALSPQERTVYYYANGECHFQLGEYSKAIDNYRQAIALCYDRDKGDSYFRLGFCYHFLNMPTMAQGCFLLSEYYYSTFLNTEQKQPRREQIRRMMQGLRPKFITNPEPNAFAPPPLPVVLPCVQAP